MGPALTRSHFVGKSSQNSSKPVLIFWSSIPCVFCLYIYCTLLKVVSYYGLSDGFPKKKKFGWGVDGLGELYPRLFWIFGICLTLQSPLSLKVARNPFLPSSLKDTSPIHINLASRRLNSITVSLISSCPCVLSEMWTLSTSTLSSV